MQRQGDKISDFGTYSTAETAQTKKLGTHVFDNSDVLRVSLSHQNYREWVVADAVASEPVSLLFGKNQRLFRTKQRASVKLVEKALQHRHFSQFALF
jgi:hypothetical protein